MMHAEISGIETRMAELEDRVKRNLSDEES
jgi:hypothetical protein